jgi:uncharacterized membrane protein
MLVALLSAVGGSWPPHRLLVCSNIVLSTATVGLVYLISWHRYRHGFLAGAAAFTFVYTLLFAKPRYIVSAEPFLIILAVEGALIALGHVHPDASRWRMLQSPVRG